MVSPVGYNAGLYWLSYSLVDSPLLALPHHQSREDFLLRDKRELGQEEDSPAPPRAGLLAGHHVRDELEDAQRAALAVADRRRVEDRAHRLQLLLQVLALHQVALLAQDAVHSELQTHLVHLTLVLFVGVKLVQFP